MKYYHLQTWHYSYWNKNILNWHGVKRVPIRSYSGPHFRGFSRIRSEYGEIWSISPYSVRIRENPEKMRTRITPNTESFYAVWIRTKVYFALLKSSLVWLRIWVWIWHWCFTRTCQNLNKMVQILARSCKTSMSHLNYYLCNLF